MTKHEPESERHHPARRARFVEEYLIDLNGTQAAIRAGYSIKTARTIAYELLAKPEVQEAVATAKSARAARTEITADSVMRELAIIAFADTGDFARWDSGTVSMVPSEWLPPEKRRAVAEVSQGQFGVRVKLHDKGGALSQLARHLGLTDGRKLTLDLPDTSTADGVAKAQAAVVAAMGDGRMTPAEASVVASVLEARRRAIETLDHDRRLTALETAAK
jgi:phage terminase small subunit